jgi:hypothetical protein
LIFAGDDRDIYPEWSEAYMIRGIPLKEVEKLFAVL